MFEVADLITVGAEILGMDAFDLANLTNIAAAEQALTKPFAQISGHPLYPETWQRAAALATAIMHSRPLPAANVQAALVLTDMLIDQEGHALQATPAAKALVFRSVANRWLPESAFAEWFREHIR